MRRSRFGVACLTGVLLAAAWTGVAAGSPKPLPLSARLLTRGEFAGFTLEAPIADRTPKAWVASDTALTPAEVKAQVARLTREGFKEELSEFLDDAQGPQNGLSSVLQLGSAASARAELAAEVRSDKAQGLVTETFRVSAIPGAFGFVSKGGSGSGENITFADGPFVYLVGNAWTGSPARNPRHAALIEAATKLYRRVHGRPVG